MYIYIQIYKQNRHTQLRRKRKWNQQSEKHNITTNKGDHPFCSFPFCVSLGQFRTSPFFFSRGQNYSMVGSRQTWRLDVSARLQMSTPSQGFQHRECIVMGDESSPGQLYQQLSPSYYLIYKSTSGTFNIGQVAMRLTAPSFNIKSWHALEGSSAGLLWLGTLVNHAQVLVFSSSLSQSKISRTCFEPDVPLMHASIELLLSMK